MLYNEKYLKEYIFMKLLLCLLFVTSTLIVAAPKEALPMVKNATFTNKLIDGKKTWLPTTYTFKVGQDVALKLVNTLADPHGFSAPGLTEDIVVLGGQTKTINFSPKKAGVYPYKCQLHPAHVGGTIIIE